MGKAQEGRMGFRGQSLVVELMEEGQLVGPYSTAVPESRRGGGSELNAILDRALDDSYTYLKDIDEYGTTIFSRMQLRSVVPELERLRTAAETEAERQVLERVLKLARRVGVHEFLVFLGD